MNWQTNVGEDTKILVFFYHCKRWAAAKVRDWRMEDENQSSARRQVESFKQMNPCDRQVDMVNRHFL